jgi:flagellar biosynthesis protein
MNGFFDFRKKVAPRPAAAALKYDPVSHDAPEVVAAGHGLVAEEIMRIAKEHNVPLHEDAQLVEALSRLQLTESIPRELYAVVAEVIAYVFRVDAEAAKRSHSR